jgi:hypothetical protein
MSLDREVEQAHACCPCVEKPWAATKCRNCATTRVHTPELCEWRGHAAVDRVVQATRADDLERTKPWVDKDPAIAAEVRKILQWAE